MLFRVCSSLRDVLSGSLSWCVDVGCLLLVVRCLLLLFVVCWLMRVVCCVCYVLFVVRCVLFVVYCLVFVWSWCLLLACCY